MGYCYKHEPPVGGFRTPPKEHGLNQPAGGNIYSISGEAEYKLLAKDLMSKNDVLIIHAQH